MGITGLLGLLKEAQEEVNLNCFAGKTVGVDGYVWLHKGAFTCATELALQRPTSRYVDYVVKKIRMLQAYGIKPYIVFDGANLLSKKKTEVERKGNRKINFEKGISLWEAGNKKEATRYFQRSINITPEIAWNVIKELKKMGIEYLVAPYEADAQLAFLEKRGIVDFIITEDSDMLAFGCKKVVFKLDDTGNGILFDRENLKLVKTISLATFTNESFRHMCILSGCDYLDSVHNVALKKAHKYLLQNKQISKVVHLMRCDGLNVPPDYLRMFDIADKTFLHQKVFDPIEKRLRHLEDLSENVDSEILKYFGDLDDDEIAHHIAIGEIDPSTHRPFADSSCLENSTPKDNLLSRWIRPKPALKGHSSEPILHKSHGDHSKTTDKPPTPSYITPTNRTTTICTSSFRSFSRSPSVTSSASSTTSSVTTTPTSNTISSFFSSSTSTSTSKSMSLFPANIPLGPKRLFSSTSLTESRAGLLTSDFQVKRRKSSIEPDTNRTEKLSRFFSSSILHTPSIKLSSTSKPINGSRSSSINLSPTESIKISSILKPTKKP